MFTRKNAAMSILSALVVLSLNAWVSTAHADGEMKQSNVIDGKAKAVLPQGYVSQGGLTWMPVTRNKKWPDANAYCSHTAINGQTGWRLPTTDELKALYASGAMNVQGWTLIYTWSSMPNGDGGGGHYSVGLYNGTVFPHIDTDWVGVTCVH